MSNTKDLGNQTDKIIIDGVFIQAGKNIQDTIKFIMDHEAVRYKIIVSDEEGTLQDKINTEFNKAGELLSSVALALSEMRELISRYHHEFDVSFRKLVGDKLSPSEVK